jgi:purine-binding chemotaxis protein CheW
MEQLADISAVLGSQRVTPMKAGPVAAQWVVANEAEAPASPRISNPAIATQPDTNPAQAFADLADKMQYLANLTTHMLERSQTLNRTVVEPRVTVKNSTLDSQYLSFTLDGMAFAVSMLHVHALMEATQLIPKPDRPAQSRRAVRLGSSLVPIIDLGVHFAGKPVNIGASTSIIVVEVPVGDRWQRVGLVADMAGRILNIPWGQIEAPVMSGDGVGDELVLGIATVNNHRVTLLDIERALLVSESGVLRTLPRPAEQQELPT